MRVGNSYSGAAEDTAVSVGEIFPTFRKIVLPSLSWIKWSQEETEGRFVGNVRIHSPNNRASHPAVPKCSEAQIFQIHFFKNAVELCYFLFEILTVTCHIETNIVELWIVALVVWYVGFKVSDEPIVTCCRYSATREHGVISQKATK